MEDREYKFYAFISCASGGDDEKWARRLQRRLENYRIPTEISPEAEKDEGAETLPKRFTVSRDDIIANRDPLAEASALEGSRYLIVVCSPRGARSAPVDERVRRFLETDRRKDIIPFIIDGTPAPVSAAEQQCYPPSLTPDILGITLSEGSREEAFIKIIARLLRVKYSRLYQRHLREQRRFIRRVLAAASATLAVMIALATWALLAESEAKARREAADGLVTFLAATIESAAFQGVPAAPRSIISERIREHYAKRGPEQ